MAIESGKVPESQEDASIVVEHVGEGEDEEAAYEEAAYEEAWQIVNEKTLWGWKLREMKQAPGGVELLWEASDGRRRQV